MSTASATPTINVTIGRQTRIYHAYITTAPASFDAPSTVTIHTAAVADVSALAADPVRTELGRRRRSGRLVLVETTQFVWQRARYREGRYVFTPADPQLVGLNALQHWLWNRIGLPPAGSELPGG